MKQCRHIRKSKRGKRFYAGRRLKRTERSEKPFGVFQVMPTESGFDKKHLLGKFESIRDAENKVSDTIKKNPKADLLIQTGD